MADVVIKFEREGLDGIVPVGTYLGDAIKRFGIRLSGACDPLTSEHNCRVAVTRGSDLLSPFTMRENEQFPATRRTDNERLACEAKIIKSGEIVVMTEEKKQETADQHKKSKFAEDFESLPLEKKIANLMRMEIVTLSETVSYVLNSPYKIFEKVGDVMAEFGMKLEQEAKKASRPADKKAETAQTKETGTKEKPAAKKRATTTNKAKPAKE